MIKTSEHARRSSAAIVFIALIAGAGGIACYREAARHDSSPGGRHGPKSVMLIGIDGAGWNVIGPMIENGELGTFARLAEEGTVCPDLRVAHRSSPVAWTSIATSRTMQSHGISSHISKLPNGDIIPVSSVERRTKAIWDVASEAGRTVGVVGWWASWPAERVNGFVVSDHANPVFVDKLAHDRGYWTADREALASLKNDFYPAEIGGVLEKSMVGVDAFPSALFYERTKLTRDQQQVMKATPWFSGDRYSVLRTFFLIDYNQVSSAIALLTSTPVDLALIYLRAVDPIQHMAWDLVEPQKFIGRGSYTEHPARDKGLVESGYRHTDAFLKELLAVTDEDTMVIVVSDHGAEPHPSRDSPRPGGHHSPNARAVLFLHGPGIQRGKILRDASPYDVMPTVLWALGLPISQELEGRVLVEAFVPTLREQIETHEVPTYGSRVRQPDPQRSSADEKMLESLRSLGYIQ